MLHASSASDSANRKATDDASNHSPSRTAPRMATVISRFMSGRSRTADRLDDRDGWRRANHLHGAAQDVEGQAVLTAHHGPDLTPESSHLFGTIEAVHLESQRAGHCPPSHDIGWSLPALGGSVPALDLNSRVLDSESRVELATDLRHR